MKAKEQVLPRGTLLASIMRGTMQFKAHTRIYGSHLQITKPFDRHDVQNHHDQPSV